MEPVHLLRIAYFCYSLWVSWTQDLVTSRVGVSGHLHSVGVLKVGLLHVGSDLLLLEQDMGRRPPSDCTAQHWGRVHGRSLSAFLTHFDAGISSLIRMWESLSEFLSPAELPGCICAPRASVGGLPQALRCPLYCHFDQLELSCFSLLTYKKKHC